MLFWITCAFSLSVERLLFAHQTKSIQTEKCRIFLFVCRILNQMAIKAANLIKIYITNLYYLSRLLFVICRLDSTHSQAFAPDIRRDKKARSLRSLSIQINFSLLLRRSVIFIVKWLTMNNYTTNKSIYQSVEFVRGKN